MVRWQLTRSKSDYLREDCNLSRHQNLGKIGMKQHGPWQIVAQEQVYKDPWICVRKDNVLRPTVCQALIVLWS